MRAKTALLLALVSLTAACNQSRQKRIAVIPKGTAHVFWTSVHEGAEKAGKDLNVQILWNGPSLETEYSRQIQILESMVAQRVDGIAISAADRKALVGPVERAIAQGIPVSIFDSGLDTEKYTTFVATNNDEAGRLAARTLAKLIGNRGKIAVIRHVPGSASTLEREQGFFDAVAKEFPGIEIVASPFGMSDRSRARAAAENILEVHSDLSGIFASAEPSSVGAALAVRSRGLAGKVKLVSFDSSEGLLEELKAGSITAMVVQDPQRMGYDAVRTLVEKLEGKQPPKRIDLSARVVWPSEVK